MEDHFAADIMDFERTHQMWVFLHQKYESTGQSTYLTAIRQEQLLRQGDSIVEDFFDQLSVVWRQLDTLGPQLSPATCPSCRDQTAALELRQTYDFLTRLRDEFEPLRAQLLARHPYVSLMDALAEVRNEEVHLSDAGLLQSATVLVARSSASRSSFTRPTASVPLASPPVVPPAAHGESGGLHCAHCGRDGHVDAFCYRKKKAQARRSSQCTGGTGSGGSKRSSADSETQEILILLHRLASSTSTGAVGTVTQSSALIGSATTSRFLFGTTYRSFSRYFSIWYIAVKMCFWFPSMSNWFINVSLLSQQTQNEVRPRVSKSDFAQKIKYIILQPWKH
jgi:hypothetical protein